LKQLTKGKFKFLKCWSFPKDISNFAEYLIGRNCKSNFDELERCWKKEPVLHIFCGDSWLGDIRVDIEEKKNVTLVSDYKNLVEKLGKESQQLIVSDPPWQIKPVDRMQISYAVRDLLKIGGKAIFNCTWNPWCIGLSRTHADETECWIPQSHFNNYLDTRMWWVFQKTEDST